MVTTAGQTPLRTLIGVPFGARTGGSEAVLLALLRHRERAGIAPVVWFGEEGGFRAEVAALGVRTWVAGPGVPRAITDVARAARRTQPDVLLSWLPRAHLVTSSAAVLARAAGRALCWQHATPTGNPRHHLAFALPTRGVVATSDATAAAQRRLRPRRAVVTVRPGIDEPPRAPAQQLDAIRAGLQLDGRRPVVAIVGRLIGWKGQERLVEAVALLRRDGLEVDVLVVGGEDPNEEDGTLGRLTRRIAAAGLSDRVHLVGQVPDARPYIQLADVLVNASDGEPFGMTLLEAMALGVPLVAVAKAGPLEIVEDGRSGVLAADPSPPALAAALASALGDPARTAALAEAARARYLTAFTAERMAIEAGSALRALTGFDQPARVV